MKKDHLYCWYSKKQLAWCSWIATYKIYQSGVGEQFVDVTMVTNTREHGTKWDDMTYLGLGEFVSTRENPDCLLISRYV